MPSASRFVVALFLGFLLIFGWTEPGVAHPDGSVNDEQPSSESQSAVELAKQASNPLSSGWLMQTQENTDWVGLPLGKGDRVQSDLLFQPLVNAKLTDKWTLFVRPVLTVFNSSPYVTSAGQGKRTTGFGDMVLAFALAPRPLRGGHLMIGAGPTFIFPTATDSLLGQHTWQLGPDVGIVWLGSHFIAYAFPQQWFKIGGSGAKTNQLNALLDFTYFFRNGWSIGTEPNLLVNWQAPSGQQVTFPIAPQVGKLCKCGRTPTQFQLQFEYYPVHPAINGPKWGIRLQITPTIPSLIKRPIF